MKKIIIGITVVLKAFNTMGQDENQKTVVTGTFGSTQLVSAQTTELPKAGTYDFKIQHRFGKVGIDSTLIQDFLGMDYTANIRLALGYSFTDRFYMAIGRTKNLKTYDIESKFLLKKQLKEDKFPLSIAFYSNIAIRTERFPTIPDSAYFEDWNTPFYYKPSHRLTYNTQIIFASKINDWLSLQLTPILIYENLVLPDRDNYTAALSFSGRFKTGISSSVIFEYAHVLNNRAEGFINPASLGIEFATPGHIFQIFITTSQNILEQRLYTQSSYNLANAEFLLGFNIKRNFWKK